MAKSQDALSEKEATFPKIRWCLTLKVPVLPIGLKQPYPQKLLFMNRCPEMLTEISSLITLLRSTNNKFICLIISFLILLSQPIYRWQNSAITYYTNNLLLLLRKFSSASILPARMPTLITQCTKKTSFSNIYY